MHLFRKKNAKSLVNSKKSSTFACFFRRKRKFEKKRAFAFFVENAKFFARFIGFDAFRQEKDLIINY